MTRINRPSHAKTSVLMYYITVEVPIVSRGYFGYRNERVMDGYMSLRWAAR